VIGAGDYNWMLMEARCVKIPLVGIGAFIAVVLSVPFVLYISDVGNIETDQFQIQAIAS
jgi:hypothetical protein